MNVWLLATVIVLIVAVVIFVGCIAVVIFPLKNVITVILAHMQGLQKQLEGIQTQAIALTATMDKMKTDIDYKKQSFQTVVQSVKDVGTALNELNDSSQKATTAIVKQFQNDEEKQAQVERWTNTAVSFLNRKAN